MGKNRWSFFQMPSSARSWVRLKTVRCISAIFAQMAYYARIPLTSVTHEVCPTYGGLSEETLPLSECL
jgi:hypothetical protein